MLIAIYTERNESQCTWVEISPWRFCCFFVAIMTKPCHPRGVTGWIEYLDNLSVRRWCSKGGVLSVFGAFFRICVQMVAAWENYLMLHVLSFESQCKFQNCRRAVSARKYPTKLWHVSYYFDIIVRCRYNAINFLQRPHLSQHIARLAGARLTKT